ncbi:MAG: hydroxymethylbilane synthase [Planctomycetota bacterium]|nr:hydroxymethylbilane synthase [Planctomycetota bacterium]
MRRSRRPLVIASRRSLLARAQAQLVGNAIARIRPEVVIHYITVESEGDALLDAPLADAGGKGLFTRAVEAVLLDNKADLAVHSLKDLPAGAEGVAAGLAIAATPRREDVRDCLISRAGAKSIVDLPPNAVLGTASPRRAAQALRLRPDLQIKLIRGNVETRIRKVLEDKQYDATLLAMAGLRRSGLEKHANFPLGFDEMLPAACQGALVLQCRAEDHVTLSRCLPLNDPATGTAVHVERQLVAGLAGDCHSAIAALVEPAGDQFRVRVRVLNANGSQCIEHDETATARALARLPKKAVASLAERGARKMLDERKLIS